MREIKFRGKTPEGNWVHGMPYFVKSEPFAFIIYNCQSLNLTNKDTSFDGIRVIPETIGQLHNGLTKKARKEVYVGDKIRYDLSAGLGQSARICQEGVVSDIEFDYSYYTNIRVLGSIHDNPELVKGATS